MKFNYTHGNKAKYMVNLYGWDVEDHYYCDTYKAAKKLFDSIRERDHEEGTVLSITDLTKDIRKEFVRF